LIGVELKIGMWAFRLGAKGQGPNAMKMLTWQHFLRDLALRVQPFVESLGPARIETQILAEGPNIFVI
jgi:hypothetical protein